MHLKYGKIFETYGLSKNVELTKLNMNNVLNQISTKKFYIMLEINTTIK